MSIPITFWAAKSTSAKSSQARAHAVEPAVGRITPQPDGMVLNDTTNGVKKSNWADSDDEDEFLASFHLSGRVKELEKTVSAKDTRITELTTTVQERDARINELESTLKERMQSLAHPQSPANASAAQVAEMKKECHKQFLHVQKLVAEVDGEDRRIVALETDVDEHRNTIAELDVGDGSTQASSHDATSATEATGPSTTTSAKVEVQHEAIESMERAQPTAQFTIKAAPTNTNVPISSSAKTAPTKALGPIANHSAVSAFTTPAAAKHTAPLPPAPKLKMPVDLSKFAKKPAAKTVSPKKKIEATSDKVEKEVPSPKIDPTLDIRTKRRDERALFANGPKVEVKMGDTTLAILPKYVLMQCSYKAFIHFSDNPETSTYILSVKSMDEAAAKAHLVWMKEMTYQRRVYSITLHSAEKFDDKNLQLCRAARVLGLNNMYIGHFTKIFCDRIRSNTASYEFMDRIAALAYPENDPVYDCLANNLANLCTRNPAKKTVELEAFLMKHADLKARIEKIQKCMREKQEGAKAYTGPKVVHVGKKM